MHFHCTKCNTAIFLSSGKNTNPDLQFFSPLKPVLPFNPQPRKNLNPCTHKKALQQKTLFTQKKAAAAAAANQRTSTQTTRPRFLLLSRCAHKRDKAPGERIHFSLSLSPSRHCSQLFNPRNCSFPLHIRRWRGRAC